MKVIFLDIDGVLNSVDYYRQNEEAIKKAGNSGSLDEYLCSDLDPEAIQRLNYIIAETGAFVVISSTWRRAYWEKLPGWLDQKGFEGSIIDRTPSGCVDCVRGCEIRSWLSKHKEVTNYVIIDDDSDMLLWQKDNFVNTSNEHGLTDADALNAIEILRREEI